MYFTQEVEVGPHCKPSSCKLYFNHFNLGHVLECAHPNCHIFWKIIAVSPDSCRSDLSDFRDFWVESVCFTNYFVCSLQFYIFI